MLDVTKKETKNFVGHCKLTPRQLKAMDLILSGVPLQNIASELNVSRQTVSEWKNQNRLFKVKLEELRSEAEEELRYSAPMNDSFMLGQLRKLATEGSCENKLKAVQFYFDRFGPRDVGQNVAAALNPSDALILQAIQERQERESATKKESDG